MNLLLFLKYFFSLLAGPMVLFELLPLDKRKTIEAGMVRYFKSFRPLIRVSITLVVLFLLLKFMGYLAPTFFIILIVVGRPLVNILQISPDNEEDRKNMFAFALIYGLISFGLPLLLSFLIKDPAIINPILFPINYCVSVFRNNHFYSFLVPDFNIAKFMAQYYLVADFFNWKWLNYLFFSSYYKNLSNGYLIILLVVTEVLFFYFLYIFIKAVFLFISFCLIRVSYYLKSRLSIEQKSLIPFAGALCLALSNMIGTLVDMIKLFK